MKMNLVYVYACMYYVYACTCIQCNGKGLDTELRIFILYNMKMNPVYVCTMYNICISIIEY